MIEYIEEFRLCSEVAGYDVYEKFAYETQADNLCCAGGIGSTPGVAFSPFHIG